LTRNSCSALFQQQVQFIGTVRDNITGCESTVLVDDDRIWSILDQLRISTHIKSLDGGLDALLGREFGGQELSVGEWQRLAFARALYCQGNLLLLDEPTSASDEYATIALAGVFYIQRSIVTTLVISHDFHVIKYTDRVLHLDAGKVRIQTRNSLDNSILDSERRDFDKSLYQ
jgi:ATP-binding cassette subfamily B protein